MRTLVVAVNQEKNPYPVMPIGAAHIAASLEDNGYEVRFLDLMFCKNVKRAISKSIKKCNPQVVLISIRNTDNQVLASPTNYIPELKETMKFVRKNTKAKIIIGGTAFTNFPEKLFNYLEPDHGIAGEGEQSVIKLLRNYSPEEISGLVYKKDNGEIVVNRIVRSDDLDVSQYKALSYINLKKYLKKGASVGIQTRRGCRRKCIYCSDSMISGKKIRSHDPVKVVEDIKLIKNKYRINHFFFVDELFSDPIQYAKELLRTIIKSNINIKFEIEDAPPSFDDEYVSLLKEAGCLGVMLTADSGSDIILKNIRKGFRKKHITDTCNLLHKYKLPYCIVSLLGNPGENLDTVSETFELFKKLPDVSAVIVNYGLRIARGAEIENITKERGLIDNGDDLLFPKYFLSKNFDEDVFKYVYSECRKNPGWLTLSRIDLFILNLFDHLKLPVSVPVWKQAKMLTRLIKPVKKPLSFLIKEFDYSDIRKNPDVVFY